MNRSARALCRAAIMLLAGASAPEAEAQGCDAPGTRLESDRYVVVYRTRPKKLAVGEHFAIDALVCAKGQSAAPSGLRVDATMPEHRHGMNYRATVAAKGGGRYVAEGLLFHMPGRWQLLFDVEARGSGDRLTTEIVLE
jgi:hypothetical protein